MLKEFLSYLVGKGADPNFKDEDNNSCLYHLANTYGVSRDPIEFLVAAGANTFDDGLRGACKSQRGQPEIISLFLSKGANPNALLASETSLHLLTSSRGINIDSIKMLLDAGGDLAIVDEYKRTVRKTFQF